MKSQAGFIGSSGGGLNWRGSWASDTVYSQKDQTGNLGDLFYCAVAHVSSAETEPGVGAQWGTVWARQVDMLTPGADGAIAVCINGVWVVTTAADLLANSLQATGTVDSGSVAAGAVTVSEDTNTSQLTSTSLTFNATELTAEMIAGLVFLPIASSDISVSGWTPTNYTPAT